jgi:hypothetical protein
MLATWQRWPPSSNHSGWRWLQAWRVLRPNGLLVVAFGSHFFPEKALAGWSIRSMAKRTELVTT